MSQSFKDCGAYGAQIERAKEMLGILEDELFAVRKKLQKNPENATDLRELKRVTLEMTITLNELEHSQHLLDQCLARKSHLGLPVTD